MLRYMTDRCVTLYDIRPENGAGQFLQPRSPHGAPKPIIMCCSVLPPEIVMHDAYIGGRFRQTKITRKASDVAKNLQLYRVVRFFHLRPSCMTHIYRARRSENNIKCVVMHDDLGWKNRTTRYNCRFSATSLALRVIFSVS